MTAGLCACMWFGGGCHAWMRLRSLCFKLDLYLLLMLQFIHFFVNYNIINNKQNKKSTHIYVCMHMQNHTHEEYNINACFFLNNLKDITIEYSRLNPQSLFWKFNGKLAKTYKLQCGGVMHWVKHCTNSNKHAEHTLKTTWSSMTCMVNEQACRLTLTVCSLLMALLSYTSNLNHKLKHIVNVIVNFFWTTYEKKGEHEEHV